MTDTIKTIDATTTKPARRGPLVEDSTVEGGLDAAGRPAIRPKRVPEASEGADFRPTDPRPLTD